MRRPQSPPRIRSARTAGITVTWIVVLVGATISDVEAKDVDERERWVPSVSAYFDTLGHKAEGAVRSGNVMGPPLTTTDALGTGCLVTSPFFGTSRNGGLCPAPFGGPDFGSKLKLRPDTESDDTNVVPGVGIALELMTPRLFERALSPRLFAHGDVIATFGFERNVAGEGQPDRFSAPELPPPVSSTPEVAVRGQGSRAKFQTRRWMYAAGIGVAFTTRVFDRTVRLKPSFEYLLEEVDLIGSLNRAVQLEDPSGRDTLEKFRLVELTVNEEETLHGLGGGLELEIDSQRLGPFMASVFLMGRGYRYTGNLKHTLTTTNEFGETATFRFEFEPWAWRAGAGLRFRWLPE